jgi:hypothetical protein
MKNLKISLRHGNVTSTPCSIIFIKHIESTLSMPEIALDKKIEGKLSLLYSQHEQEDRLLFPCENLFPFKYIYTIIYHSPDLPFSYSSVDKYARQILRLSVDDSLYPGETITSVATAVHGPGAGLDASESLETMLMAFSNELQTSQNTGNLEEIIIVEQDKDVFERLQERLKYLMSTKALVVFTEGDYHLNLHGVKQSVQQEITRVSNLTLEHIFIAMPYAKEFNNIYYFGIKQVVEKRGRKCERVDQDKFTGDIVQRIKERIKSSQLVIADITGNNPNVFYEVGFADGSEKTIILISQEQKNIPFDFKTQRQIIYDPQDILGLANNLGEVLDEILHIN